jgi:hypothetical protein
MTLVVFVVVLMSVTVAFLTIHSKRERRITSHRLSRAGSDIRSMESALYYWSIVNPDKVEGLLGSNYSSREIYSTLSGANGGIRFLIPNRTWETQGEPIDGWGRPFRAEISRHQRTNDSVQGEFIHVRFWSFGPDGKDDRGQGDVIGGRGIEIQVR